MSVLHFVDMNRTSTAALETYGEGSENRSLIRVLSTVAVFVIASLFAMFSLGAGAASAVSSDETGGASAISVEASGDGFATLSTSVGEFVENSDGTISVVGDDGVELFPVEATGVLADGSTTSAVSYKIVDEKLEVTWSTTQASEDFVTGVCCRNR